MLPAHRLAGEPGTPVRFTFHGAEGEDKRAARYAQTGLAVISPPQGVRRPGLEPGRPKALIPETSAATCYATSAYTGFSRVPCHDSRGVTEEDLPLHVLSPHGGHAAPGDLRAAGGN